MLPLLLLLFLLHLLGARDVPKDSSYVIKTISSCPDVGYFLRRDSTPNSLGPGACYLCFCQNDGTAVCWRRENKRCDAGNYHQRLKRDTRVRRSPLGLSDIFFRDAARDVFNRNTPQTCKPYETSFSEGCPPADWCIGCTVCDCDANGRWDCHVLSFCPDKEDNSVMRTAKKSLKKANYNTKKTKRPKTPNRTTKNPKTIKAAAKVLTRRPNRQAKNSRLLKNTSLKATYRSSPKPLIIKKDISTRKPIVFKSNLKKIMLNATDREGLTQEVVKRVVSVMQRMLNKSQIINNQLLSALSSSKIVQKRSMNQNGSKKANKFKPASYKKKKYKRPVLHKKKYKQKSEPSKENKEKNKTSTKPLKRQKREVNLNVIGLDVVKNNMSNNNSLVHIDVSAENEIFNKELTADSYYKYSVVSKQPSNDSSYKEPSKIIYVGESKNNSDSKLNTYALTDTNNVTVKADSLYGINNLTKDNNKIFKDGLSRLNNTPIIKIVKSSAIIQDYLIGENFTTYNVNTSKILKSHKLQVTKPDITTVKRFKEVERVFEPQLNTIDYNNRSVHKIDKLDNIGVRTSFKTRFYKKINDIQDILKNLLSDYRTNHTRIIKRKSKKFNVMKYLKRVFKKIFRGRNRKSTNETTNEKILTNNIIEAICEIIGSCNENQKKSKLLRLKVKALNIEANTILRSVTIIKGLLHLLNFNNTNKTDKVSLKDDINKLNFILKKEYVKTGQELTQNQRTQINYIKINSSVFIKAVGRFATILSDIITILVNKKAEITDARNRRNTKRMFFEQNNANMTITKEFHKLKKLLLKYNLIQNTFIRKIYEIMKKFENSQSNVTDATVSNKNAKKYNTSIAIEKFSRNIIENLRKLKNLAEILNSKTRRKRSIMRDDDTLQYLLKLMEHLIKLNYHLDAAPVNDGIDLLIEAIKSAPDVKPVKKKVLHNISPSLRVSRTTGVPPVKIYNEDISLNSNSKSSKEDNTTSNQYESRLETANKSDDLYREGDGSSKNIFDENTESVYYKKDYTTNQKLIDIVETTLPYPIEKNNEDDYQTEIANVEALENEGKSKKIDVFLNEIDNKDSNIVSTSSITTYIDINTEPTITSDIPIDTTEMKLVKVKQNIDSKVNFSDNGNRIQHITLDWLDEGYDSEAKDVKIRKSQNIGSNSLVRAFTTSKRPALQKHFDTISSITKEFSDEEDKRRLAKINTEEVIYKKQMDLLNSLDYGTERSELEESEPKDDRDDPLYYN